jgi:hypothetical protein
VPALVLVAVLQGKIHQYLFIAITPCPSIGACSNCRLCCSYSLCTQLCSCAWNVMVRSIGDVFTITALLHAAQQNSTSGSCVAHVQVGHTRPVLRRHGGLMAVILPLPPIVSTSCAWRCDRALMPWHMCRWQHTRPDGALSCGGTMRVATYTASWCDLNAVAHCACRWRHTRPVLRRSRAKNGVDTLLCLLCQMQIVLMRLA